MSLIIVVGRAWRAISVALILGQLLFAHAARAADPPPPSSDEIAALEYLELIQKGLHAKFKTEPAKFDEKFIDEVMAQFMRSGANSLSEEILVQIRRGLIEKLQVLPRSRYEDIYAYTMLQSLDSDIRAIIEKSSIPLKSAPLFGTLPTRRVNARTFKPPNSERIVVAFEDQVFNFANLYSKAIVQALPVVKSESSGRVLFSVDVEVIRKHLLESRAAQLRFNELIVANIVAGRPGAAPQYFLPEPHSSLAGILRDAMELFVLGHEYGHVIGDHLGRSKKLVASLGEAQVDELLHSWKDELEADWIGFQLCFAAMRERNIDDALTYSAIALFMRGMELVEASLSVMRTGREGGNEANEQEGSSHPPWVVRRQFAANSARKLLGDSATSAEGLENAMAAAASLLWPSARDDLMNLRRNGVKAHFSWDAD